MGGGSGPGGVSGGGWDLVLGVSGPGGGSGLGVWFWGVVWSLGGLVLGGCLVPGGSGPGGSGLGGLSGSGGGCLVPGGLVMGEGGLPPQPPPANRITHACENIT